MLRFVSNLHFSVSLYQKQHGLPSCIGNSGGKVHAHVLPTSFSLKSCNMMLGAGTLTKYKQTVLSNSFESFKPPYPNPRYNYEKVVNKFHEINVKKGLGQSRDQALKDAQAFYRNKTTEEMEEFIAKDVSTTVKLPSSFKRAAEESKLTAVGEVKTPMHRKSVENDSLPRTWIDSAQRFRPGITLIPAKLNPKPNSLENFLQQVKEQTNPTFEKHDILASLLKKRVTGLRECAKQKLLVMKTDPTRIHKSKAESTLVSIDYHLSGIEKQLLQLHQIQLETDKSIYFNAMNKLISSLDKRLTSTLASLNVNNGKSSLSDARESTQASVKWNQASKFISDDSVPLEYSVKSMPTWASRTLAQENQRIEMVRQQMQILKQEKQCKLFSQNRPKSPLPSMTTSQTYRDDHHYQLSKNISTHLQPANPLRSQLNGKLGRNVPSSGFTLYGNDWPSKGHQGRKIEASLCVSKQFVKPKSNQTLTQKHGDEKENNCFQFERADGLTPYKDQMKRSLPSDIESFVPVKKHKDSYVSFLYQIDHVPKDAQPKVEHFVASEEYQVWNTVVAGLFGIKDYIKTRAKTQGIFIIYIRLFSQI